MNLWATAARSLAGSLAGLVASALVVGRVLAKVDIRTHGDGNPGAANRRRGCGWPLGLRAFFLDTLKGAMLGEKR